MADGEKLSQMRRARLAFDCIATTMYFGPRMRVLMLDNPELNEAMENLASKLVEHPELFRGGEQNELKEYISEFGQNEEGFRSRLEKKLQEIEG